MLLRLVSCMLSRLGCSRLVMQSVMASKLLLRSEYCCLPFLSACLVLRCAIVLHNGVSFFEQGYRRHEGYHLSLIIYATDFFSLLRISPRHVCSVHLCNFRNDQRFNLDSRLSRHCFCIQLGITTRSQTNMLDFAGNAGCAFAPRHADPLLTSRCRDKHDFPLACRQQVSNNQMM
jgi:hypothetical protein